MRERTTTNAIVERSKTIEREKQERNQATAKKIKKLEKSLILLSQHLENEQFDGLNFFLILGAPILVSCRVSDSLFMTCTKI